MEYLTIEDIIYIHEDIANEFKGEFGQGIHNKGLLESAVNSIINYFLYLLEVIYEN